MESFERAVIDGLSGVKKILPNLPFIQVKANLDSGKVTVEVPAPTSGVRIPADVTRRLAETLDQAGMTLIQKWPPPAPMPLGLNHLPVNVDVMSNGLVQIEFRQRAAGFEMEAWQAIQLSEVLRRSVRAVAKINRRA
jgi:hypothetical protein